MELLSRRSHLQGKPHLAKVAASGTTVVRDSSPVILKPRTTQPSQASQKWTCEPCGRRMDVRNREQHL
ncbi:hypothetical protein PM082_006422 [Marasmius tenuissimus]|nr:hypothetical protein PM082_006422 [Marasmius tenuissimus]